MRYIYLHGLASGPQSTKAQFLKQQFQATNITLEIPDLNQNDFQRLTLTRQIQQIQSRLHSHEAVTLIGSSFGGQTAAWIAETTPQVQRLVLPAPAFDFIGQWLPTLSAQTVKNWAQGKPIQVYHHGLQQQTSLNYEFLTDLQHYNDADLQRYRPTLILHGEKDETISHHVSRNFTESRSWVTLRLLDSDHGLLDHLDEVWQQIQAFCQI